jgi:hypothetical protein
LRGALAGKPVAHAMVALDLQRTPDNLLGAAPLAACREEPSIGVLRVVEPQWLKDEPAVLLVECTGANVVDHMTFSEAVDSAARTLSLTMFRDVHLVDIAVRREQRDYPLEAPTATAALRSLLPGPRHALQPFSSRKAARDGLAKRTGRILVYGESGLGKSELARNAAAGVDGGIGWILTATNKAALIAALAEHELLERGWDMGALDAVDREAFARDALTRLATAESPWAVVVDNADCKPSDLRDWLPVPNPKIGQALIVTSTNGAWLDWDREDPIRVGELKAEEVAALLGDSRLVRLTAGRPLLIHAFADSLRYLDLSASDLADQLEDVGDAADALAGPRVLWSFLQSQEELGPAVEAAQLLAWLLPDHTPVATLRAAGLSDQAAQDMVSVGVAAWAPASSEPMVSMHRLFGRVIREDLRRVGADTDVVIRVLSVSAVRELLMLSGDMETTKELSRSLKEDLGPREQCDKNRSLGMALWALASMQEMHESVSVSAATFARAMSHLNENNDDDRPLIADCLHGRAREINQYPAGDVAAVALARSWMRQAIELRAEDDLAGRSRHRALDGLLLQRHARDGLKFGSSDQIAAFHEAKEILEQSWRERRDAPEVAQRQVDRASFNRAGVCVDLAQRELDHAVVLLETAEQVYRETLAYRKDLYRDPHPLTAASHYGVAASLYYQALLDPGKDREAVLVEATQEAITSLQQRWDTDGGRDGRDVVKSASLLAKILLARMHGALSGKEGDRELASVLLEIARELPRC